MPLCSYIAVQQHSVCSVLIGNAAVDGCIYQNYELFFLLFVIVYVHESVRSISLRVETVTTSIRRLPRPPKRHFYQNRLELLDLIS